MTPNEKAKQLIDNFIDISVVVEDDENHYHTKPFSLAKKCAIFTANLMISAHVYNKGIPHIKWWQEVKQELEKL